MERPPPPQAGKEISSGELKLYVRHFKIRKVLSFDTCKPLLVKRSDWSAHEPLWFYKSNQNALPESVYSKCRLAIGTKCDY